MKKISVIGAGCWGTTLSVLLAKKGFDVVLWCRRKGQAECIGRKRENTKYLPGIKIPYNVTVTDSLKNIKSSGLVIVCVPSEYVRSVLKQAKPYIEKSCIILSASKGLETGTPKRISQMMEEELSSSLVAVLSGPNHSEEISIGLPAATVIASENAEVVKKLKEVFSGSCLKVCASDDVAGVESCGAFKNIVAIAVGICDELKIGDNAKGAVVVLGLKEMGIFSEAMGGQKATCYGLAGIGDLITTCESRHSRNRLVGRKLAMRKNIDTIKEEMHGMVAEGVTVCKAVYEISKRKNIKLPLTGQIYKIIYEEKSPDTIITGLLKNL